MAPDDQWTRRALHVQGTLSWIYLPLIFCALGTGAFPHLVFEASDRDLHDASKWFSERYGPWENWVALLKEMYMSREENMQKHKADLYKWSSEDVSVGSDGIALLPADAIHQYRYGAKKIPHLSGENQERILKHAGVIEEVEAMVALSLIAGGITPSFSRGGGRR